MVLRVGHSPHGEEVAEKGVQFIETRTFSRVITWVINLQRGYCVIVRCW